MRPNKPRLDADAAALPGRRKLEFQDHCGPAPARTGDEFSDGKNWGVVETARSRRPGDGSARRPHPGFSWVLAMVEMNRPMPRLGSKNKSALRISTKGIAAERDAKDHQVGQAHHGCGGHFAGHEIFRSLLTSGPFSNDQDRSLGALEFREADGVPADEIFNHGGLVVAVFKPDDLWAEHRGPWQVRGNLNQRSRSRNRWPRHTPRWSRQG